MTWSNFYRSERDKIVEGKDKDVAEKNKNLIKKRQLAIKSIVSLFLWNKYLENLTT